MGTELCKVTELETRAIFFFFFFLWSFQGSTHGIQKFPGQGSNWSSSSWPTPQLQQSQILNPLSKARDCTNIFMDTMLDRLLLSHNGNSQNKSYFFCVSESTTNLDSYVLLLDQISFFTFLVIVRTCCISQPIMVIPLCCMSVFCCHLILNICNIDSIMFPYYSLQPLPFLCVSCHFLFTLSTTPVLSLIYCSPCFLVDQYPRNYQFLTGSCVFTFIISTFCL